MKHKKSEKYDICDFCSDFWGEDRTDDCKTVCACASYANQDYVYQKEKTVGLPAPKSLNLEEPAFKITNWGHLPIKVKKIVVERTVEIYNIKDPVLFRMFTLLMEDHTKDEICKEMDIDDQTFDSYASQLRNNGKKEGQNQ